MICQLYYRRGFQVRYIYTDNEFADLTSDLMDMGIYLNVCAANEHVPAIERRIRLVKERHRCVRHGLPFACVPKLMTIELNYFIAYCLNAFPPKGGVSVNLSPSAIVTGHTMDYVKHCKLEFGEYVQTHEENTPRNSMKARTIGAIALGPDNSKSGGYNFMNLNTGKKIHRRSWTQLPMPSEVVKRVEQLGRRENQPEIVVFTDKNGKEYQDDPKDFEEVNSNYDLSYGSEYTLDKNTGVSDNSVVSYESIPERPAENIKI